MTARKPVACLVALALLSCLSSARAEVRDGWSALGAPALESPRQHHVRLELESSRASRSTFRRLERVGGVSSLSVLVIGCDFSDSLMFGRDRDAFPGWPQQRRQSQVVPATTIPMFTAHDAVYFDLQMQRVSDYFASVSFGAFTLDWDVHPEIVNVGRPMGYYGDADSSTVRLARLAQEVASAVDAEVDFSAYDTLVLIHAGAGKETDVEGDSRDQIFSNYLDATALAQATEAGLLAEPAIRTGERAIEHVLVLPESESQDPPRSNPFGGFLDVRGVYCFEFGLRMGMLSLADFTPGNFPDSQGIGNFGLMGYGLFTGLGIVPSAPSAMNRALMGWVTPVDVREDARLRIRPMLRGAHAAGDTLLVRVPINDREYFLLEYRLQDVDGDLFYTFSDSNQNVFPDYFDASNAASGGWPNSTFDPAEDFWERELDAEWDYFMSENPARSADRCERGGGSGLYIWHVDERVIEASLSSGSNTINADPLHKGVDVEEADGIQDLDSASGSPWLLGGDDDVWRAEGNAEFGPDTSPSTDDTEGLRTGIRFHGISAVVASAHPKVDGYCTGFEYADAMTLNVEFGASITGPELLATRQFAGFGPQGTLRVADIGSAWQDATPDGRAEIVTLADGGQVLAFDGALEAWNPSYPGSGRLAGVPPGPGSEWVGGPVLSDLDGDDRLEIHAATSSALVRVETTSASAVQAVTLLDHGPVGDPVVVGEKLYQVFATADSSRLLSWASGDTPRLSPALGGRLGSSVILDPTTELLASPWASDEGGGVAWWSGAAGGPWGTIDLGEDAPATDLVWLSMEGLGPSLAYADSLARPVLFGLPGSVGAEPGSMSVSSADRSGFSEEGRVSSLVAGPASADRDEWVIAYATADALFVCDAALSLRRGFPYRRPRSAEGHTPGPAVAPLLVDLDDDGRVEILWHDGSGGLHAVDLEGRSLPGWPLSGPSDPSSPPALGDVDGDGDLELVSAGRFERLTAVDLDGRGFDSVPVGEIRVHALGVPVDAFAPWAHAGAAMGGGGRQEATVLSGATGTATSFSLRPNPVTGSRVRVRAELGVAADVEVEFFTLEGERISHHGPYPSPVGAAFDREFDVSGWAGGLYLCRVRVGDVVEQLVLAVVR